jgi:hypothetical protein
MVCINMSRHNIYDFLKRFECVPVRDANQFYLGFIHETNYLTCEASWLTLRQQRSWAQGKVTELVAFINDNGVLTSSILSYNGLDPELNSNI